MGKDPLGWQLLEPVDLIAYSALAAGDLGPHLATAGAREAALTSKDGPVLKGFSRDSLSLLSPHPGRARDCIGPSPPANDKDAVMVIELEKSDISTVSSSPSQRQDCTRAPLPVVKNEDAITAKELENNGMFCAISDNSQTQAYEASMPVAAEKDTMQRRR